MRKLIWGASLFAFVPALAGVLSVPFSGAFSWWSLAAGTAVAALAFGAFLEMSQSAVGRPSLKSILPVVLPVIALVGIGALGAVCMEALNRAWLRPESFVAGIVAGTLFCQAALVVMSQRLKPAPETR